MRAALSFAFVHSCIHHKIGNRGRISCAHSDNSHIRPRRGGGRRGKRPIPRRKYRIRSIHSSAIDFRAYAPRAYPILLCPCFYTPYYFSISFLIFQV
jgi:hypothetical protein